MLGRKQEVLSVSQESQLALLCSCGAFLRSWCYLCPVSAGSWCPLNSKVSNEHVLPFLYYDTLIEKLFNFCLSPVLSGLT